MTKNHNTRNWVIVLLVLLLVAAALAWWRFGHAQPVQATPARQDAIAVRVLGPGTVQARSTITLASRISAQVVEVRVDEGDATTQGQLLVVLDDRESSARLGAIRGQQTAVSRNIESAAASVARARAELSLAQARHRRDTELQRQGFVSQSVVDASTAAWHSAQAGLDAAVATLASRQAESGVVQQEARAADVTLTYTRLHAPFNGIVIQRLVEPGSTVMPGSPVLQLADPDTLWVATRVDESVVGRVQLGQKASVRLRSGETGTGTVARIARKSDAATRERDVFVALDRMPAQFAIDQEADVSIDTGSRNGLVVPLTALVKDRSGQQGVLVVSDGRAHFRAVITDTADQDRVMVTDGLKEGELVIDTGSTARANQAVRVTGQP
ncbi:MAG: efflux RND transporter periplasmic adaptor subunit [Burkholderiaceae bacterium]